MSDNPNTNASLIPPIPDYKFDLLLDDVMTDTINAVDRLFASEELMQPILHMALVNKTSLERSWARVVITEDLSATRDRNAMFAAIGSTVNLAGLHISAAFWVKDGKMRVTKGAQIDEASGYLVLGMTNASQINGGFLIVDPDRRKAHQIRMFYYDDPLTHNAIDTEAMDYLFRAARHAISDTMDVSDELTRNWVQGIDGIDPDNLTNLG